MIVYVRNTMKKGEFYTCLVKIHTPEKRSILHLYTTTLIYMVCRIICHSAVFGFIQLWITFYVLIYILSICYNLGIDLLIIESELELALEWVVFGILWILIEILEKIIKQEWYSISFELPILLIFWVILWLYDAYK